MAELVYRPVIGVARTWFKALDLKIDTQGTENIPRSGGAVLVSNHISYLDFIFVSVTSLPQKRLVRFMAKESVFRHRISGPLMRGMKHIPVDRKEGEKAYADALRSLRSGEIVGVFPEATISQSFTLKSFKSGAARLAQEAGVPLIPMALWGTQRLWTKGRPRNFRRNHIPVTIRVGERVEAPADQYAGAITRRLRERVQELLEAAQRAYPVRPRDASDTWWVAGASGRYGADGGRGTRGRDELTRPGGPTRARPRRRRRTALSSAHGVHGDPRCGAQLPQPLREFGARRFEFVRCQRRQPLQQEERVGRRPGEPGAGALAPVPAPAGDAFLVAPDDLARLGVLHHAAHRPPPWRTARRRWPVRAAWGRRRTRCPRRRPGSAGRR